MKNPMKYVCFTLLCLASFISIDARELFEKKSLQVSNLKSNTRPFCGYDGQIYTSNTNTVMYNSRDWLCRQSYAVSYYSNMKSILIEISNIYIDCDRSNVEFWDSDGNSVYYCDTNKPSTYKFTTSARWAAISRHGWSYFNARIRFSETLAPVTVAPVTVAPVTVAPVTVAPVTNAPSSACGVPAITPKSEVNTKIVGGVEAIPGSWPWMAGFYDGSLFCGGSLINDQWILTAAHCKAAVSQFVVKLGDHYSDRTDQTEVTYTADKWISHPGYDENDQQINNDIALVKLKTKVTFNSRIKPICLPNGKKPIVNIKGTATGWGLTDKYGQGRISNTLQQVDIPINQPTVCTGSAIPATQFCAGDKNFNNPLDSCQGDSGGPFVVKSGSSYYQMGVVSYGYLCTGGGVYTNVQSYESWIASTIANN